MQTDMTFLPARPTGVPLLRIVAAFPVACFSGALATDVAYAVTADMIWADFSAWLLAAGIAMAVLAALVGLVDLVRHRRAWPFRLVWPVIIGGLAVLTLGFLDNLVHSRDAWTSVVPAGLALSAITMIVTLATSWIAGRSVARPPVLIPYAGVRA